MSTTLLGWGILVGGATTGARRHSGRATMTDHQERASDGADRRPSLPGDGALDRNLGMELVRVTEAAALSAGRWMGKGAKESADQAAVDAMRFALQSVDMDGVVVIGEGEKDEAPMLYIGERVGSGHAPEVDVAVDPIDGTTVLAKGLNNALAIVGVAPCGTLYYPPLARRRVGVAGGLLLSHGVGPGKRCGYHRPMSVCTVPLHHYLSCIPTSSPSLWRSHLWNIWPLLPR